LFSDSDQNIKTTLGFWIQTTQSEPWPGQVVALGLIARMRPKLAAQIIRGLEAILRRSTTTPYYPQKLVTGASEAAFDALAKIAADRSHPHTDAAYDALNRCAQHSKEVAIRMKAIPWDEEEGQAKVIPLRLPQRPQRVLR
jgi:hypothetical protein